MDAIDIMLENDIFYKFFHIPQQSGSDSVLKVMGRENSSDDYLEIVRETRKDRMANIMTDIIVGHPGESEDDFLESMEIIRKSEPDTTNVSKYSARPGTPAAKMQQVDRDTINERSVEMSGLCNRISRERNEAWVGSECEMVVFEANVRGVVGRNGHYKHIALQNAVDNVGNGLEVSIIGAGIAHLKGKLKQQE